MGTKNFGNYSDLITFTRASSGTALRPISYGDELVVNGTFDTDLSGWSVTSGGTISRDTIVFTNGGINVESTTANARRAYQSFGTTAGKTYALTLTGKGDGTNLAVVRIGVSEGDTSILSDTTVAAVGDAATTKTIIFNATTSTTFIGIGPTGAFVKNAYFDNISVREVLFDQPNGILTLFNHPNNIPRIEYDANGNLLGLLVEESRSNILTYSNAFENAFWSFSTVGSSTIQENQFVSPDGANNASKIYFGGGDSRFSTPKFSGLSIGATYTGSIWIYSTVNQDLELMLVQTGTVYDIEIISVSAGWNRFSISTTLSNSDLYFELATVGNGSLIYNRPASSGEIYIYGAQLEAGSFPTSYIPTSGSTATRSADVASIGVSEFGYNQSAGALVCEFTPFANTFAATRYIADAGSNSVQRLSIGYNPAYRGGAGAALTFTGTIATNQESKMAVSANSDGYAITYNGVTPLTNTSALSGDVTKIAIGISATGASNSISNSHIKSIKYYPRRLTDAQLQELTS